MDFEFFKLANVEENSVVTEDTYSLVVNGNDVQKTKNNLIRSKFYKDFTDEYEEWASQQQATQRKDIETFVKTLITTDGVPYKGYIESTVGGTALFEVAGDNTNSKQHLEVFYESVVSGEVVKNLKVCDFYNSTTISNNIYYIIDGQLRHSDVSNLLLVNGIVNRGDLENTGSVHVDNNLHVDGHIDSDSSVDVHGTSTNTVSINGNKISLYNNNTGINLLHNNDECLTVEGTSNNPIEIKNVSDPTLSNSVANKNYVDNKANDLINDYVGRINSVINRTQSSSVCCIKRPYFFYDTDPQVEAYRFIGDSNIIPNIISTQEDTIVYIAITGQGIANNVEFLYAYYTLSNDEDVRYYNADVTYNRSNLNEYFIRVTIPNKDIQDNPYISNIYIVYLQSITDIELPELVALRNPYDSNQTISSYSTRTQYTEGNYCYYPNSTSGSLYICLSATSGTWDSTKWLAVMARDSIDKALQDRLRVDGSLAMTGSLNMGGTNKIINVADPTSGTDAVNKNYVDNKGFTLDSHGMLSFG